MDRDFQISTLWQKVKYANSTDPNRVCNGISDIMAILDLLDMNDVEFLDPLETAYDVADVALGLGETVLQRPHAHQVQNLIEQFTQRAKERLQT